MDNKDFFEAFKIFEPKKDDNDDNDDDNKNDKPDPIIDYIDCSINDNDLADMNDDDIKINKMNKMNIKSCKSMERISQILTYYISWINQIETSLMSSNINITSASIVDITPPSIGMFDIINSCKYLGEYNNTKLLNDYHHIISSHKYHLIHKLFTSGSGSKSIPNDPCCFAKDNKLCTLLIRNYRNRNKNYLNNLYRSQLYYGYITSTEITTQQILDYIHCYIYHSYELGIILNTKQSQMLHNHLSNYKQIELSKSINNKLTPTLTPQTPQSPMLLPKRGSMIYNQQIIHNDQSSVEHSIVSDLSSEPDESLSFSPMPEPVANTISKHSGAAAPVPVPVPSNTFLKPGNNSLYLEPTQRTASGSTSASISASGSSNNIKKQQVNNDVVLEKKIKLANSKIVVMREIMKKDKLNKVFNQLLDDNNNTNKFINILASYNHLFPSIFKDNSTTDGDNDNDNKSNSIDDHLLITPPAKVNNTNTHQYSSSSMGAIVKDKIKLDPHPGPHNYSSSTTEFAVLSSPSPSSTPDKKKVKFSKPKKVKGLFKRHRYMSDGSIFRNKKKNRTKTDAAITTTVDDNDIDGMDITSNISFPRVPSINRTKTFEDRVRYLKNSINDTTNNGLTFDYGFRYYYWDYYKTNNDRDHVWNHGSYYKDWYIKSKYNTLKSEMLNLSKYNPQNNIIKDNKDKNNKKSIFSSIKNKDKDIDNKDINDQSDINNNVGPDVSSTSFGMSIPQWNDINERVHHIYRTSKCKSVKCDISIFANEYGVSENDLISKEHILSILIFCTFNCIRSAFLLTYNQYYNTALLVEENKTITDISGINQLFNYENGINLMKKNHSYFVNLARLIRECVECFGNKLSSVSATKYYFGINNSNSLFKRTISKFKSPLLCTSSFNVALKYLSNQSDDGLLIELSYYDPFIRYFNCSYFTEYFSENEIIFCGGLSSMKISTIYEVSNVTCNNYIYFIRSMNILQSMFLGRMKKDLMTSMEEQIIRYFVQNEFIRSMNNDVDITNNVNGSTIIPNYISLLFHHFCINLKKIIINLHRMNDISFYGYFNIKSLFLTSQNNFIKLDVLCSLFPNVPTITVIGHKSRKQNCIKLDELFFEEVLLILDSNLISKKCKLTKIIISHPNESELTIENAISKYKSSFNQKGCKMILNVKKRELIIQRGITAIRSTNTDYNNNKNNDNDDKNCLIM